MPPSIGTKLAGIEVCSMPVDRQSLSVGKQPVGLCGELDGTVGTPYAGTVLPPHARLELEKLRRQSSK